MSFQKTLSFALCSLLLFSGFATANDKLEPGNKAPAIDVEHWVSNGKGKFKKITEFEEGKVYIIEFWATWCPPCIDSMPHLAKLQKKYADKGLQIISISDEDLETVEGFLKGKVPGSDGQTYAELTSNYCLTTDPDKSSHKDYMRAAKQRGIPAAFIVGKKGDLELICHPMELDDPIEMIMNDKWDPEVYEEMKKKKEASQRKMMEDIQEQMGEASVLMQQGDYKDAIEIVDGLAKKYESHPIVERLKGFKMQAMMMQGGDEGVKALESLAKERKDDAVGLNEIAWGIVELKQAGEKVDEKMIAAATRVAEAGVKLTPKDGAILDTYAHLLHMGGDLDKAIEVQKKAVANSEGELADQVQPFLDELLEEKEDKK